MTSSADGENAVRTKLKNYACTKLRRFIEKKCKYDLSVVTLHFSGTPVRSRKGAIIFDLNAPTIRKRKNRE